MYREIKIILLTAVAAGLAMTLDANWVRGDEGGGLIIENNAKNGSPVNFSINAANYSLEPKAYVLKPGQTQLVSSERRSIIIQFDRGFEQERMRYILSSGLYRFKLTDTGWDLVRVPNQGKVAHTTAKPPLVKTPEEK